MHYNFRKLVEAALLERSYSMSRAEAVAFFKEHGWQEGDDLHTFYKKLARVMHPDAPGGSTELMAKLNGAYDTLTLEGDPGQDSYDHGYNSDQQKSYWTPGRIKAAMLVIHAVPFVISLANFGFRIFRDKGVRKYAEEKGVCPKGYYAVTDRAGRLLAGCATGRNKDHIIFLNKKTSLKKNQLRKRAVNEHIGYFLDNALSEAKFPGVSRADELRKKLELRRCEYDDARQCLSGADGTSAWRIQETSMTIDGVTGDRFNFSCLYKGEQYYGVFSSEFGILDVSTEPMNNKRYN